MERFTAEQARRAIVTVGSIGTLTINVMALTWARLARRDPARERPAAWATALIALATVARVLADLGVADARALALAASSCWSAAYLLHLTLFSRMPAPGSSARPR